MATKVLTPAQIREKLRIGMMHPADRPKEIQKELLKSVNAPVQEAIRIGKQQLLVATEKTQKAAQKAEEIEQRIEDLKAKVAATTSALQVRQRMTPQDMRDALHSLFDSYNFSPAEELVEMVMNREHPFYVTEVAQRIGILKELNAYVMPKLKTMEIKGKVNHDFTINIVRIGEDGAIERPKVEVPPPVDVEEVPGV